MPVFSLRDLALSAVTGILPEQLPGDIPFGVLLNVPIAQTQLEKARAITQKVLDAGADILYFSDPAILSFCNEQQRKVLVYRPETLLTSPQDAAFWMEQGIGGISVSPLLTKSETTRILSTTEHAEVTIHGHLLLSVSHRKLLSAWKDYYQIDLDPLYHTGLAIRETTRQEDMPVYETDYGTMVFSDFVLESFEELSEFKQAEAGFIDGSFLDSETLLETLNLYQQLLNGDSCIEAINDYRMRHPECSKGYYDQKTIL